MSTTTRSALPSPTLYFNGRRLTEHPPQGCLSPARVMWHWGLQSDYGWVGDWDVAHAWGDEERVWGMALYPEEERAYWDWETAKEDARYEIREYETGEETEEELDAWAQEIEDRIERYWERFKRTVATREYQERG